MRILLPLIALFFMGCVFYRISAGVQAIASKAVRLVSDHEPDNPEAQTETAPSPRYLHELQELHELHLSGALSQEEFQQLKQHLLSAISTSAA